MVSSLRRQKKEGHQDLQLIARHFFAERARLDQYYFWAAKLYYERHDAVTCRSSIATQIVTQVTVRGNQQATRKRSGIRCSKVSSFSLELEQGWFHPEPEIDGRRTTTLLWHSYYFQIYCRFFFFDVYLPMTVSQLSAAYRTVQSAALLGPRWYNSAGIRVATTFW